MKSYHRNKDKVEQGNDILKAKDFAMHMQLQELACMIKILVCLILEMQ